MVPKINVLPRQHTAEISSYKQIKIRDIKLPLNSLELMESNQKYVIRYEALIDAAPFPLFRFGYTTSLEACSKFSLPKLHFDRSTQHVQYI